MRYVFTLEERDLTIGAMDVFFYMCDPQQWVMSASRF